MLTDLVIRNGLSYSRVKFYARRKIAIVKIERGGLEKAETPHHMKRLSFLVSRKLKTPRKFPGDTIIEITNVIDLFLLTIACLQSFSFLFLCTRLVRVILFHFNSLTASVHLYVQLGLETLQVKIFEKREWSNVNICYTLRQ